MRPHLNQRHLASIATYGVCIGLIPVYVNMFPVWKYLNSRYGNELFIYPPVIILAMMVAAIWSVRAARSRHRPKPIYPVVLAGIAICLAGLIIPDPAFPVKRIHVAEYLLLALLARFAMAPFLRPVPLLVFSSCFAALLGIHDEFLQGLHPARTYGLRDMSVNALASFGGGLIGHGLWLFHPGPAPPGGAPSAPRLTSGYLYPCWLWVTVMMLVVPAFFFRGMPIDLWTIVPLIGSAVIFSLHRTRFRAELAHGITAVNWAAWSLAFYSPVSAMRGMVFY